MDSTSGRLGTGGLTAIVVGAMIGAGIFNIAQNMAAGAGARAVASAWAVTAVGMLALTGVFWLLSSRFPHLDNGIYEYARAGFGDYAGFNVAWGYWLCVAVGNVAYAVMLNDALGAFFPVLLRHSWPTVLLGAAFIWGMYLLVRTGLRTAAAVNTVLAVLKFSALALVIAVLAAGFKADLFAAAWADPGPGTGAAQVRSTMMVTVWCFLGIEGAVMLASKAKRRRDVGRAGAAGFLTAWILYAAVSILCYGVMARSGLASLDNPSLAALVRGVAGEWAYWFVLTAVILSLGGGWLAWTLLVAQTPYGAAEAKVLPKQFLRTDRRGTPVFGLAASSVFMTVFMVVVCTAGDVYLTALSLTSVMVLPAYLTSSLFLCLRSRPGAAGVHRRQRAAGMALGAVSTVYCLWLMWSAGLMMLLASSLFYLLGVPFYAMARRQYGGSRAAVFAGHERWVFGLLCACGAVSAWLLFTGRIAF